jgi:NAD(P)-dependent dehydrogenase (short-subunit alcohol dehydrogenase family)
MSNQSVAVITGANRGLGLETCRQLSQLGWHVVLTARDKESGRVESEKLVQFLKENHSDIGILENNAGIFPDPPPPASHSSIFDAKPETVLNGFVTNT